MATITSNFRLLRSRFFAEWAAIFLSRWGNAHAGQVGTFRRLIFGHNDLLLEIPPEKGNRPRLVSAAKMDFATEMECRLETGGAVWVIDASIAVSGIAG